MTPIKKPKAIRKISKRGRERLDEEGSFYVFTAYAKDETLRHMLCEVLQEAIKDWRIRKRLDQIMDMPVRKRKTLDVLYKP